jgi:hypothetical protein
MVWDLASGNEEPPDMTVVTSRADFEKLMVRGDELLAIYVVP